MLNASVMKFDATGRIRNTTSLPTVLIAGAGFNDGLLSAASAPVLFYPNGNPTILGGQLAIQVGNPDHYGQGGLPIAANGAVAINVSQPITHWNAGLPYTANGALAFATAEAPAVVDAFDSAFSGAFG